MSNPNYISGRAFEYAIQREWESLGYSTIRASGSHGNWDVVAYDATRKPEFIQCKVVARTQIAERLIKKFRETTLSNGYYHKVLAVKVKGSSKFYSVTI